jgi:hypothetical protein
MKPLNHKEKSKKLYFFILHLLLLAILPCFIIAWSYNNLKVGMQISQNQNLNKYTEYKNLQEALSKNLSKIDINLTQAINANNTASYDSFIFSSTNYNAEISKKDTSDLSKAITKLVNQRITNVKQFNTVVKDLGIIKQQLITK